MCVACKHHTLQKVNKLLSVNLFRFLTNNSFLFPTKKRWPIIITYLSLFNCYFLPFDYLHFHEKPTNTTIWMWRIVNAERSSEVSQISMMELFWENNLCLKVDDKFECKRKKTLWRKPSRFKSDFLNSGFHELLFRHIFEMQIHTQKQIRKNFILSLATDDILKLLLKYCKELSTSKLLTYKQVSRNPSFCRYSGAFLRRYVNLSKTCKIWTCNFWITWPVFMILWNLYLYTFSIDWSLEKLFRNLSFCR